MMMVIQRRAKKNRGEMKLIEAKGCLYEVRVHRLHRFAAFLDDKTCRWSFSMNTR